MESPLLWWRFPDSLFAYAALSISLRHFPQSVAPSLPPGKPWAYNGMIFVLSEEGSAYVIDPADDFTVVGSNDLGEVAMSSPAIARGSLFIRTRSHLWRLSED